MITRITFTLLWAIAFASIARAQDAAATKPTGECTLAEGEKTAPDGSCGKWTAKLKSATSAAPEKKKKCDKKCDETERAANKKADAKPKIKDELKPTLVLDLSHLRPSGPSGNSPAADVAVYFCVTTAHDAHKDDKLIVAVTGANDKSANYCKHEKLQGKVCVKKSSGQDLCDCEEVGNYGRLKGRGKLRWGRGGLRWCVDRKDEKEEKKCRHLPMKFGEKLSVWITKSKDNSLYAEERSASGTWTLVK